MSSVADIVASLGINSVTSVVLVCVYAVFKNQPLNSRVYFAKWIARGQIMGPQPADFKGFRIGQYLNFNLKTYVHIMDWIKASLEMPEAELIEHAGLDSAIYLRMIKLGIEIFLPMMVYGFVVLVPINVTDTELTRMQRNNDEFTYSALDTITISNIRNESPRLWAHLIAAYLYTAWTCILLFRLYRSLVDLRFRFLGAQVGRPDQFTVLCRCIPQDPDEPVKQHVEHFFRVNHPDYYLLNAVVYDANALSRLVKKKARLQNKVTYLQAQIARKPLEGRPTTRKKLWGFWGDRVDKLDFCLERIDELTGKIHKERFRVLHDDRSVMQASFVSFETRWAAAVCAQTMQSKDSSKWLTEWAPEPRDIYWTNLPVPYLQLNSRKVVTLMVLAFMVVFFLIPVSFVQSLANLDKIERNVSFLEPLIELRIVKSILQGFLPGLSLKIFLAVLPHLLTLLSIFEGHVSYSKIEKHACIHYLAFMLVNVFMGNIVTGTAFEQLKLFIESPTTIPSVLGKSIPQRAAFFITYIMVDGWTNCAIDLVRVWPFLFYHVQNITLVRTETDRDKATPVGRIRYTTALSRLGLYFLLGFVYSTIAPLILPFILIFLGVAYVVYRNQIIHAYEQRYESNGQLWPVMFSYVIIGLLVMHATLIGLMALKEAASSTPFLLPLPCCTILFWFYCRRTFEVAFQNYPLEEAKAKDNVEKEEDPNINRREFLETAYMHPALRASLTGDGDFTESDSDADVGELLHRPVVTPAPREGSDHSRGGTSSNGKITSAPREGSDHSRGGTSSNGKSDHSRGGTPSNGKSLQESQDFPQDLPQQEQTSTAEEQNNQDSNRYSTAEKGLAEHNAH